MKILSCYFKHWQYLLLLSLSIFGETGLKFYFNKKIQSNFFFPILSSFALLFFVIPENIYIYINQAKQIRQETRLGQFYYQKVTEKIHLLQNKKLILKSLFLILLGFLTVAIHSISIKFILLQSFGFITTPPLFCVAVTWLLHYMAFKRALHRHHITALIIMFVDTLLYYIFSFDAIDKEIIDLFDNWGLFVGLLSLNVICISLREVIEKYLMEIHFVTPSLILLIEGYFSLLIYIIIFCIFQAVSCPSQSKGFFNDLCLYSKWKYFMNDFKLMFNFSTINTLYIWGFVICCFASNFFRILTNKKLSPTHRYVAEILLLFYWFIHNLVYDIKENKIVVLKYISVVFDSTILIIACCIYNEFIIIFICNLNENTRLEVEQRASRESVDQITMSDVIISDVSVEIE